MITEIGDAEGDRNVTVLAPITYDFGGVVSDRFLPFIVAGAGVTTSDETDFQIRSDCGCILSARQPLRYQRLSQLPTA